MHQVSSNGFLICHNFPELRKNVIKREKYKILVISYLHILTKTV